MKPNLSTLSLAALLAASQPLGALAQQQSGWAWPGAWAWWISPLTMLLLIVLCIAVVLCAYRTGSGAALQLLDERFAQGEIQKREYEERKSAILSGGHA